MNYICPQCSKEMISYLRNIAACAYCSIEYYGEYENRQLYLNTLRVNHKFFVRGSFDYCCRYFKLKTFI